VVTAEIMVFLVVDTNISEQYDTSIFMCCDTICPSAHTLLHTHFIPEDEGSMFLWNAGIYLQNYMVLKFRRPQSRPVVANLIHLEGQI
jgi:hypothetical protein